MKPATHSHTRLYKYTKKYSNVHIVADHRVVDDSSDKQLIHMFGDELINCPTNVDTRVLKHKILLITV